MNTNTLDVQPSWVRVLQETPYFLFVGALELVLGFSIPAIGIAFGLYILFMVCYSIANADYKQSIEKVLTVVATVSFATVGLYFGAYLNLFFSVPIWLHSKFGWYQIVGTALMVIIVVSCAGCWLGLRDLRKEPWKS